MCLLNDNMPSVRSTKCTHAINPFLRSVEPCTRAASALMQYVLNLRQQPRPRCMHGNEHYLYSHIYMIPGFKPMLQNTQMCEKFSIDNAKQFYFKLWLQKNKLNGKVKKVASNS
jgi:hypothetical protein